MQKELRRAAGAHEKNCLSCRNPSASTCSTVFHLLQPYLEEGKPLRPLAIKAGISYQTDSVMP